jgi:uncharacterized protein YbjT (DUF2867 family)
VLDDLSELLEGAECGRLRGRRGPGSGAERKRTVDLGAAVKLLEGARHAGVRRYLMISSMGAGDPAAGSEAMRPYLEAKAQADAALAASDLDWTIVRPGGSRTSPGRDASRWPLARRSARSPATTWPRSWSACLDEPRTVRATFELLQGETPIAQALAAL